MCHSDEPPRPSPPSLDEPLKPRKRQVEVLMQEKRGDTSCARDCYRSISAALWNFFGGWGCFAWTGLRACLDIITWGGNQAGYTPPTVMNRVCASVSLLNIEIASELRLNSFFFFFCTFAKDFWWFEKKKNIFVPKLSTFALGVFCTDVEEFSEGTTGMKIRSESQRCLTSFRSNLELKRLFYIAQINLRETLFTAFSHLLIRCQLFYRSLWQTVCPVSRLCMLTFAHVASEQMICPCVVWSLRLATWKCTVCYCCF